MAGKEAGKQQDDKEGFGQKPRGLVAVEMGLPRVIVVERTGEEVVAYVGFLSQYQVHPDAVGAYAQRKERDESQSGMADDRTHRSS